MIQLYIHMSRFFFKFFSHLGYWRVSSRVLCDVQYKSFLKHHVGCPSYHHRPAVFCSCQGILECPKPHWPISELSSWLPRLRSSLVPASFLLHVFPSGLTFYAPATWDSFHPRMFLPLCAHRHSVNLTLWPPATVAGQTPLSLGFCRQEYWSELPFLPPGDLPDPGVEPASPALAGEFCTPEPHGKPLMPLYLAFIRCHLPGVICPDVFTWSLPYFQAFS